VGVVIVSSGWVAWWSWCRETLGLKVIGAETVGIVEWVAVAVKMGRPSVGTASVVSLLVVLR
jgi:hypothetical protein